MVGHPFWSDDGPALAAVTPRAAGVVPWDAELLWNRRESANQCVRSLVRWEPLYIWRL